MLCEKFDSLSHKEKVEYIGMVVHGLQMDNTLYEMGKEIIRMGTQRGLFDTVKILPDTMAPEGNKPLR